MNKKKQTLKHILADWLSATLAWGLFYGYRKLVIESEKFGYDVFVLDKKFYLGILLIPVFWIAVYALVGAYRNIYRKSRLKELGQTLYISVIGVLLIFFLLINFLFLLLKPKLILIELLILFTANIVMSIILASNFKDFLSSFLLLPFYLVTFSLGVLKGLFIRLFDYLK